MYKYTILSIFVLFNSCTVLDRTPAGTQKIQIRIWKDRTPVLLADNIKNLDIAEENIIEFDVVERDEYIYLAYSTDKRVETTLNPKAGNSAIIPEISQPTENDRIAFIQEKDVIQPQENHILKTTIVQRCRLLGTGWMQLSPMTVKTVTQPLNPPRGVWVRLLKGRKVGPDDNYGIDWQEIFATDDPMDVSDIKIADIESFYDGAIVAVTNHNDGSKKVIVMYTPDRDGQIQFLENANLFSEIAFTPKSITSLNTWRDIPSGKTYITAFFDNYHVTGYLKGLKWNGTYNSRLWSPTIHDFQVKNSKDHVYGLWTDSQSQKAQLLVYDETRPTSERWMKVDCINSVKHAKIATALVYDINGIVRESVQIGAANSIQNFFQLYTVIDQQLQLEGPIIGDWNERYSFAVNDQNHILYVRAQNDQNLIFAGLNSLKEWDILQKSTPPPVKINPTSDIYTSFLQGKFSLTVFKQDNGSLYVLEGAQ